MQNDNLKFKNKKNYLPNKNNIYNFIFALIILTTTFFIGNWYIPKKLNEINHEKIKNQNLSEKREDFIKNFTKLGQNRIYLAEVYYRNKKESEKIDILDRAWENYYNSVMLWNEENLLFPLFIKDYFSNDLQKEFYDVLQKRLVSLHEEIIKLRDNKEAKNIDELIESAKNEMFIFSEKLISIK